MRELLFGTVPVDGWPPDDESVGEPWDGFVRARQHLANGDQDLAIREWSAIAGPGGVGLGPDGVETVESRHVVQAWRFLRGVGVAPDASIAARALGVVVEVAIDGGHDVLAAYADGSVRFLHHAGGGVVLEAGAVPPEGSEIPRLVTEVIAAGQALADHLAAFEGDEMPELTPDHSRLTVLTPGGPRFGQGPLEALEADEHGGPLFQVATQLFVAITELH